MKERNGNIGAEALKQAASSMETAARAGRKEELKTLLSQLIEHQARFIQAISQKFPQ